MTHMSPTPSVHRVRPAGPPTLAAHQLRAGFASLADLLRQIGHDERIRKLESLALACTYREPRPGDDNEFTEPEAA